MRLSPEERAQFVRELPLFVLLLAALLGVLWLMVAIVPAAAVQS